jgi:hypothetical protein
VINLSLPSATEVYYFKVSDEYLVGPVSQLGTPAGTVLPFRVDGDTLVQARGQFDENSVGHSEISGDFKYIPISSEVSSLPTSSKPDQIRWDTPFYPSGDPASPITCACGLGVIGTTWVYGNYTTGQCVISDNPYDFVAYLISPNDRPGSGRVQQTLLTITYHRMRITSITDNRFYYMDTSYYSNVSNPSKYLKDWSELTPALCKQMFDEGSIYGQNKEYGPYYGPLYMSKSAPSLSFSNIRSSFNALVNYLLRGLSFPLKEVHFGNLAMDASSQVNANSVNMIAFLKDLRHPTEMIPKLKNLRKLKTIADNYLTVEYGILPTISDLQSIRQALEGIKPYVDRNGFSTYNASYRDSSTAGNTTYSLEQHIKIAIEDEDSDLIQLLNRIESSGFAPTFQNIWDLVPYSFVIDWFIDIGDFLERVDTRLRISRLNIRYVTMSLKRNITRKFVFSSSFPFVGTATLVDYSRWTEDQCPLPPLTSSGTTTVSNHWLEAGALIAQRTAK